jgi:lipase chaperone LimK
LRRFAPALAIAAIVAVVAGIAGLRGTASRTGSPSTVAPPAPPSSAANGSIEASTGAGARAGEVATDVGPRPRSLRGTRVDGELTVDERGRFVATEATRRFFDYFLSATGEEPPEAIRARIVAAIARRLPPEAARDAEALLDRYLRYRERARELAETETAKDLADRFAAVEALRREIFGPEDASALFAAEEAQVRAALAERATLEDPALADDQRARRLAAAADALPAEERAARSAATTAIRLRDAEAGLRELGASSAEIQALREQMVGAEAADRLAELDERRAEWKRRVDAYRSARATIEADRALTPAERAAAIEALLADRFSAPERLRVQALDEIARSGQGAPVAP